MATNFSSSAADMESVLHSCKMVAAQLDSMAAGGKSLHEETTAVLEEVAAYLEQYDLASEKPRYGDAAHTHHRNLGRGNVRTPGHQCANYHLGTGSEYNGTKHNLRANHPFEPRPIGHRSDLGFRLVDDAVEDKLTGTLRAPTPAEVSQRSDLVNMRERLDEAERDWQKVKDSLEQQYRFENVENGVERAIRNHQDRLRQISRVTGNRHPAITISDSNLEQLPLGDHDMPFQPHPSLNRQPSPRRRTTAKVCMERQKPPHDPVTPAHSVASAKPTRHTTGPHVAAAAILDDTAKNATENIPRKQQQYLNGPIVPPKHEDSTPKSARFINSSDNPRPAPRRIPGEIICTHQPALRESDPFKSPESGYHTPDDGDGEFDILGEDDYDDEEYKESGDDQIVQSFIKIEL